MRMYISEQTQVLTTSLDRPRAALAAGDPLAFERILTEISTRLLGCMGSGLQEEVNHALKLLADFFQVDRCSFWERSADEAEFRMIHSFNIHGAAVPPIFQSESFPWALHELLAGRPIRLESLADLPADAIEERRYWTSIKLKSALAVPLTTGEQLTGCLCLVTTTVTRTWPLELVRRVQLAGGILANALTRKVADEALLKSEERLLLAADAAGSGLWSLDLRTNRFWVTDKTREIFEFPPDEPVSFDLFLSRVHPEDQELIRRVNDEMLRSRQKHRVEYRIVLGDGTTRWIAARGRVHCNASGESDYIMGVTVDITPLKQAEETLRESEERFRTLVANAGDGFELLDEEGRYIDVNPATLQQLGYTREEMLRLTVFDVDPLLTRDMFVQNTRALAGRPPLRVESVHRRKDGSTFPVEVTVSAIHLKGGIRVLTLARDITERKDAEGILRESESRFRTVADSAPVLIWMSGPDKLCNFFNQPWLEFTGRRAEQEMGNGWAEGVHPDDLQRCLETYVTAFDARQGFVMHYRLKRHDGQFRWILDRGVPRYEADGKFAGYIGSCVDVTEQKLAEEALLKSYTEIRELKDRLQAESEYLKEEIKVTQSHGEIVGNSRGIKKVLHQVEQVAPTDSTVLITGETGTGKELIANGIHRAGVRKDRVMVTVNCAALPPALVESELFGRERGAYTGALTRQAGRFEIADKSTVFLDEIGELSLDVQAKLLRVLEVGEFERLGSTHTIRVNVRLIAATNRDLAEEVRKRRFREDLFYRLNVFPITIPPLRDRVEDIPELAWAFIQHFCKRMGKKITKVPRKTMDALQQYHWPGNVRQLKNVIEHSVIISAGDTLRLTLPEDPFLALARPTTLAEHEREHILQTLENTGWHIKGPKGAARKLGLNPSTLYTRMKKLNIPNRSEKLNSGPS